MAGNSQRRGAIQKASKKGATVGSGGQRRRGLEGKGPTPKAEDREYHKAYKKKQLAERSAAKRGGRTGNSPAGSRKRAAGDAEWIIGRNAVVEALREGVPVNAVYVAEGAERDGRLREAFGLAAELGVGLLEVPKPELDRLTGFNGHQGLAARVPAYEYAHPADLLDRAADMGQDPLIVVVDHVTDPRNLGAVIRSAAAFGAHGVVVADRRAAGVTAAAWKTSAGAAARIPVAQAVNVTRVLKEYQDAGCQVVGLDMGGDLAMTEIGEVADGPLVVVVGAEGGGLSRLVAETCDRIASIPMANAVESLNAGVAASVTLYAIAMARAAR
jgi:23S rRNA (guanosine2251-2'-O)-methyltransferase